MLLYFALLIKFGHNFYTIGISSVYDYEHLKLISAVRKNIHNSLAQLKVTATYKINYQLSLSEMNKPEVYQQLPFG